MALQDLTPQLRTRLSRMERAVGWFVVMAVVLLTFGFGYYVYKTAERKGWFLTKAPYFAFVKSAAGLKVGDPVMLMGLEVGRVKQIEAMPADQFDYNMYLEFELKSPYYDWVWTEGSRVKVTTADFLGKRVVEVIRGKGGYPVYTFNPLQEFTLTEAQALTDQTNWVLAQEVYDAQGHHLVARARETLTNLATLAAAGCTNLVAMHTSEKKKFMTGIWNDTESRYDPYTAKSKPYWLVMDESAAVTERLEKLVGQIEKGIPNILGLTNKLAAVLSNSADLTSNLNAVVESVRPAISNVSVVTAQLAGPGALGEWMLGTNFNHQIGDTLDNANATLAAANTNLAALAENLARSLDNLAGLTGSLNQQVQTNTNILSAISDAITHADEFVQGLKRHWLFRSAFKKKTSEPLPPAHRAPLVAPKEKGHP